MSSKAPSARTCSPVIEPIEGLTAADFPDLLAQMPDQFSHLFASLASGATSEFGQNNARWSILFGAARAELRLDAQDILHATSLPQSLTAESHFLSAFAKAVAAFARPPAGFATELPFVGGWSFYLSYELAGQIEPSLDLPRFAPADRVGFPVAVAQYHASALIYDHLHHKTWLVHDGQSADAAESLRACLRAFTLAPQADAALDIHALQADDPARYRSGVQQVLAFLRAGDVFQANLSRAWRFSATQTDAGLRIFRRLERHNPAPFAAWYRLPEGEIISSSPERLVDHRGGQVSTRPIAGTRRRDDDSVRDAALMAELRAHPKERAEHVMLIDLERNDLGRVCQPGSVCVDELMVLESFAHVHHLVSNVCGQLRPDQSVFDLLAATFPGGTITGCPKVRCMEILAELEQTGRGPYTGSVGYLSLDGRMDSNILIRTVFLAKDGLGEFRTGAGIVADSAPERECTETEEKARGLLMALTGAHNADQMP
ncbi:aminodeoxychorismate synthase component I [Halothiobacillus neapolitanus]|uniref:Anthranilate synthase n=1 Tax=Halothiobacillus neapolitanus (strain ATCC 23641 / DSM 15147 / CIP 104769 / NCIMB 8539 / c2) TaxID=555778 RepID=D0L220_HALNC|nr:aminodeoxychorismate synthase component I [Halothiobacillus neapolitanus]ACX96743.1 Anthranilate synthase [Halothiobacillus neapolitanus c2]TDN65148.1 anthranilate synthase component 1 [Halothiobacillus neapolitanus]